MTIRLEAIDSGFTFHGSEKVVFYESFLHSDKNDDVWVSCSFLAAIMEGKCSEDWGAIL